VVKLYNASNFFDQRAVPRADDDAIAALVRRFDRVVVECHPRLVDERAVAFARRIDGTLEVAMGLETIDQRAAPRLGKGATLDDFTRAADLLRAAAIDVRVFLLVGTPFVPAAEQVASVASAARFAIDRLGACHVSLIPVRGGNGALERLQEQGLFTPPDLALLEHALDACLGEFSPTLAAPLGAPRLASTANAVVTADLWDLERLATCPHCFAARRDRLDTMNRTGRTPPPIHCAGCTS
jgi:radical SAM enzyme (TIGR01210 family)